MNALRQTDRAHLQIVCGERVWLLDDAKTQLRGINSELLRDLVELHFLAKPALGCAVAAFWAAGRLVRKDPATLKLIGRDVVCHGLQCAGIKSARDAVRP